MNVRTSNQFAHGIMFHHFYDGVHPHGQGAITANDFATIIEKLGPERFLAPLDWIEKSLTNTMENTDLCLTFDDGLLCQYDIALPVLNSYGLKAFWFIYTNPMMGIPEKLEIYRLFRTVRFQNFFAGSHPVFCPGDVVFAFDLIVVFIIFVADIEWRVREDKVRERTFCFV